MPRTIVLMCDPEGRGFDVYPEGLQSPVGVELFKSKDEILKVICPHYGESSDEGRGYCEIKKQVKIDRWGDNLGERCEWDLGVEERKDPPSLYMHIKSICESDLGRGSDETKELLKLTKRREDEHKLKNGDGAWDKYRKGIPLSEEEKRELRAENIEVW